MAWETITLGGGCFWCLEAVYAQVDGVASVEPGYCNGHVPQPSYEQVCTGSTGHAEVVQLRFDPEVLPLRALLDIFFAIHDPTTLNRQGHDVGSQYRSGIYYSDPAHEAIARAAIDEANAAWGGRVVTELLPLSAYHPAEPYHRRYFERNPGQGYCVHVVAPKVAKFRETYRARVRR